MEKLTLKIMILMFALSGVACSHKKTVEEPQAVAYSQPSDWQSSDADLLRLAVLEEPMDSTSPTVSRTDSTSRVGVRRVAAADSIPAPAPESVISPTVDASTLAPENQAVRKTWLWGSLLVIAAVLLGAKYVRDRNRPNTRA